MVDYRGSEAYDFSLFEPQIVVQSEPARLPRRTQSGQKHEIIDVRPALGTKTVSKPLPAYVFKAAAFFAVCVVLIFTLLMLHAQRDRLTAEIGTQKNRLSIAQSENVRLNAELSSKLSMSKIENYAENKLGMVKADNFQITYIDRSKGDKIVVSGNREVGSGDSIFLKIKELFEYLF